MGDLMNRTIKPSEVKKVVKASEFKAKCLALMNEVARSGQSVVITKKGEPVAELVPRQRSKPNARGVWKGKVEIIGDIISPIDIEWDALK